MAMGSDSPADGRSGVDVELQVSWNAQEAYANLDSGVYKLKTVPGILVLHARRPEAAVVKGVIASFGRALVPDARVHDRGHIDGYG